MKELFVIREKNTNSYCVGSVSHSFSKDIQRAKIWLSYSGAEKAYRNIFNTDPEKLWLNFFFVDDMLFHNNMEQYLIYNSKMRYPDTEETLNRIIQLKCDFEVVKVKLTLAEG